MTMEQRCKKCIEIDNNSMCGQAFTPFKCAMCGRVKNHHNTDTPKLCIDCSRDNGLCEKCGEKLV